MNTKRNILLLSLEKVVRVTIFLSIGIIFGCSEDSVSPTNNEDIIEYVNPEDVGWSSEKLEEAKQLAEQSGYTAVMALYDGKVFFAWGNTTRNYQCHSIRKPFLSALYGIHVAQGHINLDATMEELNIDDTPPSLTPEETSSLTD